MPPLLAFARSGNDRSPDVGARMRQGRRVGSAMLIAAFLIAAPAMAKDGDIVARQRYVPTADYAQWFAKAFAPGDDALDPKPDLRKARAYYSPALYRALVDQRDVQVEKLVYESDGLKIAGVLVRPSPTATRRSLPVILWCRGGIGHYGGITLGDVLVMTNWARRGFVVLASDYRGGPHSEGRDEDGGADVHDVEALVPLARALPNADADNLFLYGQSRGGMMVYRALADGVRAKAAAVNSGVADLGSSDRPDAADMDALAREAMPDYAQEKANHFCRRSAVCWPEKLRTPLLLLHGTADWRVPASQSLQLALELQAIGSPYSLRIVEGGYHVWLDQDQARIDREILDFFESHAATRSR